MSDLQQLYQTIILDHAKARHGASADPLVPLADAAAGGEPGRFRLGESHQVNTTCGDEVTVRVAVSGGASAVDGDAGQAASDAGRVEDLVWRGDGCSISMASASVLSDSVRGMTVGDARTLLDTFREMLRSRGKIELDDEEMGDVAAFAGVSRYPARVKCAMLPWVAFEAALAEADR